MKIEKSVISAYKVMMRALANETRLDIIYSLYDKPKTWTDLLFELRINPKSLRDHLQYLRKSGLVKKREPVGFELTSAAIAFIEISLKDIVETAKKALKIVETKQKSI